jgi:hypothetical protein
VRTTEPAAVPFAKTGALFASLQTRATRLAATGGGAKLAFRRTATLVLAFATRTDGRPVTVDSVAAA